MELKIEVTAEQIDEMIRTKLVESAIGKSIASHIQAALGNSYDSPVKKGVEVVVRAMVDEVLQKPEHQAVIRAAVEAAITKDILDTATQVAVAKITSRNY